MEIAYVSGKRETAKPGLSGTCVSCGNPMIPKCGEKVVWHWAHATKKHCDPWWENETDWHRGWKACFPLDWHEQVHFDTTGEKHIADVKTPEGFIVEFQNSPMSPQELESREIFYKKMIWIINGNKFANNFHVLSRLPRPDADWTDDIVFGEQRRDWHGRTFWRKSENPEPQLGVLMHSLLELQSLIDSEYVGQHFYDWIRPHSVWLGSTMPVYIDFGGDLLWMLKRYGTRDMRCVMAVKKETLLPAYGGEYTATGELVILPGRKPQQGMLPQDQDCKVLLECLP